VQDSQEAYVTSIERQLVRAINESCQSLMMSWSDLRELRSSGHIVGSHTLTHPNVAHVSEQIATDELQRAKSILEQQLGKLIEHFSYPSPCLQPHWTERTTSIAQRVGYRTAVTCLQGPVTLKHATHCLPRVSTPHNKDEFRWAIEASLLGRIV
jgi:peptidoglycan/xylan/chitin deacetylase (PgdA/CDA1 family)